MTALFLELLGVPEEAHLATFNSFGQHRASRPPSWYFPWYLEHKTRRPRASPEQHCQVGVSDRTGQSQNSRGASVRPRKGCAVQVEQQSARRKLSGKPWSWSLEGGLPCGYERRNSSI